MNKKKVEESISLDVMEDRSEMTLDTVDDLSKPIAIEKLLKWRKQGLSYAEIGKR